MATVSAHLPDNSQLANDFFSHVEKHFGGKPGPFIKRLIEGFFEKKQSTPEATGESILTELVEKLRPERAAKLKKHLANYAVSQPELLGKVLEAVADEFASREENAAKGNLSLLGPRVQVLVKVLPEDAHAVQAAYAFRQLPSTGEAMAQLFDVDRHKKLALQAALGAVKIPAKKA